MEETEDAADKGESIHTRFEVLRLMVCVDRAEIREIKASLLPRDEPIRTNGGTVTEL